MAETAAKPKARWRRRRRIRKHLSGDGERPRLAVFRSARHIYAQIINDVRGETLVAASSLTPEIRSKLGETQGKRAVAEEVGRLLARRAKEKGISTVAFDRGGYLYHGRVKALADAVREGGLDF